MQMTSYFNPGLLISVMIPDSWTASQVSENKFRLFSAPERGLEDFFDEYRVTMSYELVSPPYESEDNWLPDLVSDNNNIMARTYNHYTLISDCFYESDSRPAYRKIYAWTDEHTGLRLFQIQAFIYGGPQSLYMVNGAVVENLKDKYLPILESILASTRIGSQD